MEGFSKSSCHFTIQYACSSNSVGTSSKGDSETGTSGLEKMVKNVTNTTMKRRSKRRERKIKKSLLFIFILAPPWFVCAFYLSIICSIYLFYLSVLFICSIYFSIYLFYLSVLFIC